MIKPNQLFIFPFTFLLLLCACDTHHMLNCDGKDREFQKIVGEIATKQIEAREQQLELELENDAIGDVEAVSIEAVINFLAEHDDVDIDASCERHGTALQEAVDSGHVELVRLLAKMTGDINKQSEDGSTALLMAVRSGNEKMVDILLNNGADPTISNKLGKIPEDEARRCYVRSASVIDRDRYKRIINKIKKAGPPVIPRPYRSLYRSFVSPVGDRSSQESDIKPRCKSKKPSVLEL